MKIIQTLELSTTNNWLLWLVQYPIRKGTPNIPADIGVDGELSGLIQYFKLYGRGVGVEDKGRVAVTKRKSLPLMAHLYLSCIQRTLKTPIDAESLMRKPHSLRFLCARTLYSEENYCLLKYADFSEHCGCTLSRDDV